MIDDSPEGRSKRAFDVLLKVATRKGQTFEQMTSPVISFMEKSTLELTHAEPGDRRIGAYLIANTLLDLTAATNALFIREALIAKGEPDLDPRVVDAGVGIESIVPVCLDAVIEGFQKLGLPTTKK